jgi:hypothetical protein
MVRFEKRRQCLGQYPKKTRFQRKIDTKWLKALLLGNLSECNLEEVRRKSEGASEALSMFFD